MTAMFAGESYDPKESIETLIKRRLGLQFRTRMLDFSCEYFAGCQDKAELQALIRRAMDAQRNLIRFRESHRGDLHAGSAAWMPVALFP
jgi:hypothetical protein